MRMFKGQLLIFLVICVRESSCVINPLYDAGEQVWKLYTMLDETNLTSLVQPRTVSELFGNDYAVNEETKRQMFKIHVKLHEIENSINPQIIHDSIKILKSEVMLVRCIDIMGLFLTDIDNDYKKFYQLVIQDQELFERPLDNLTNSVFPNIESNIQIIRKIMTESGNFPPNHRNLITAISGYAMTKYQEICDSSQPIAKILVDVFKRAVIAEIKTSLMLTLANLHRYRENQEWKITNILAKTQFQRYFGNYVNIMQENLDITRRLHIRACDPKDATWILDENYYELDGIIQATIFQYKSMVCMFQSCQNRWQKWNECGARYYDERSGCENTATECENLGTVQACVLKKGPHKFQYVNSTVLGFMGSNFTCPEDDGYIINNGNSTESLHRATCACNCNRNHNKISLFLMKSRVESNMVITGLRFIRKNNILYIQPREGKLQANGYINQYSQKWLPIPTDIGTFQISYMNKENSIFFLDDVLLPPKFVLIGVRFNKASRGTVTGFTIEISGVSFDYRSGRLDLEKEFESSPPTANSWRPLKFGRMSPFRTKLHNRPSSTNLEYVKFERSLLEDDFGQSTLPLFDAVPVVTDPPLVLGGIGIFHKGVEGYAGFMSLRAYGIRYEQYFENFTSAHTIDGRLQLFT